MTRKNVTLQSILYNNSWIYENHARVLVYGSPNMLQSWGMGALLTVDHGTRAIECFRLKLAIQKQGNAQFFPLSPPPPSQIKFWIQQILQIRPVHCTQRTLFCVKFQIASDCMSMAS